MLGTVLTTGQVFVVVTALYGARWSPSQVPASTIRPGLWAQPPSLPTCEQRLHSRVPGPHLEHVHHLPEIGSPEPCSLLHGEALEVLHDAEAVNLSFLIFQQFLQDETIRLQDLRHRVNRL